MTINSVNSGFAEALRQATKKPHHRLDHHLLLRDLARPNLTRQHYQRVVRVMAWIHLPLHEALVDAIETLVPQSGFQISPRPTWLAEDLAFFKIDQVLKDSPLNGWQPDPIHSAAKLAGMLYVLEGSTMGGQVISRCIKENIQVTPEAGGRFFAGHKDKTPCHWGEFWRFAEEACPDRDARRSAVVAALDMFERFEMLLTRAYEYWCEEIQAETHLQRQMVAAAVTPSMIREYP